MRLARRLTTVTATFALVAVTSLGYLTTSANASTSIGPIITTVETSLDYATFSGKTNAADSAGSSNVCESPASVANGSPCSASFTVNGGRSICSVTPTSGGATGQFHDPSTGFNVIGIQMTGAAGGGAGELVGYGIVNLKVFRLQIHAHRACAAYLALQLLGQENLGVAYGVDTKPHAIDFTGDFDIQ